MDTQELIKLYEEGSSLAELSRKYNCGTYAIKTTLKDNNIKIRTRSEQTSITNTKRKKYKVKDEYFSNIDNYNKAWLLGFITADGTVRKDTNEIKIGLSSRDREILEKIQKELGLDSPIRDYDTNNGFFVSELRWTSKQHKLDLQKYGIVNNKTYKEMHLPNFKEDNLKLAFILGYFDGDGSFSVDSNGKSCRMRFCSYRNEILKDFADFLSTKYNATYTLCKAHNRDLYELSFSTKYAVRIFEDMYSLNSIKLDRKYQKYLEYNNNQETATS